MPESVFVSYSHEDTNLVQPFVALLRGLVASVFLDANGIKPGKNWRDEIANAIRTSDLVAVFWCAHSAASSEVKLEYEMAIGNAKEVMPVLLDSTPLPDNLAVFQFVDFRQFALAKHEPAPSRDNGGHLRLTLAKLRAIRARTLILLLLPSVAALGLALPSLLRLFLSKPGPQALPMEFRIADDVLLALVPSVFFLAMTTALLLIARLLILSLTRPTRPTLAAILAAELLNRGFDAKPEEL
jgi:hypothetical protein